MRTLTAVLLLICLLPLGATRAATIDIHVTSAADSGPNTLRQAIIDGNALVANNDLPRILIDLHGSSPIMLASPLPALTPSFVRIHGTKGTRAQIDGGGAHWILRTNSSVLVLGLKNVALLNGYSATAASACLRMAAPTSAAFATLENVWFQGCKQSVAGLANGAAISTSHSLTIKDSYFKANQSVSGDSVRGGAIYANGSVQISNSQFVANFAIASIMAYGGAIYMSAPDKSLTITDSEFVDNKAVGVGATGYSRGGAIYAGESVDVAIEHSSLVGNGALTPTRPGFSGGGAISTSKRLQITRSSLVSNQADHGGAIDHFQLDVPTETNIDIRNTSFILNKAIANRGGAINTNRGMLTLRNNSFWHNSAVEGGNNLADSSGGGKLAHVWNNLFTAGDGSSPSCIYFSLVTPASTGYNIVPNADCGLGAGVGDEITIGLGIIGLKLDPIDVASVWMVQDSPAVEGGNPAAVDNNVPSACPKLDAPGNARPALGIGVPGNEAPIPPRCDIGAYESPVEAPLFYGSFDDPLLGYE